MDPTYKKPSAFERGFNKLFGFLVALGLALPHNYLVIVRGRKSGREYSNPVDVLDLDGGRFLVAPRGATEWSRNALAAWRGDAEEGASRRGFHRDSCGDEQKPEILKAYLDRFSRTVKRYFPIPPGAPAEAFRQLAPRYPVFELKPKK